MSLKQHRAPVQFRETFRRSRVTVLAVWSDDLVRLVIRMTEGGPGTASFSRPRTLEAAVIFQE